MKIMDLPRKIYRRLFKDGSYGVAIRPLGSREPFKAKYGNNREWYADPFVCSHDGHDYIFVELMDLHHVYGQIAVAPVVDNQIGEFQVILSESFHMSFPNVFQWNGTWYMLPEVYMSREVRLYECVDFPYRWKLKKVLLKNEELVDHALYPKEDGFFMVSYDIRNREHKYNRVYELDMKSLVVREIMPTGDWCRERPGSTFFMKDGKYCHCIQDCTDAYGHHMHLWQVNEFTVDKFQEEEKKEIFIDDWDISPNNGKLARTHTYNCNDKFEVIDFWFDKFNISKPVNMLYHDVIHADRRHK